MFEKLLTLRTAKALLVVLIVQLAYWMVVNPSLFAPKPTPEQLAVTNAAVAVLSSSDFEASKSAQFKPIELPWDSCCDAGYRAVKMQFDLPRVPSEGLGLVPNLGSDNFRLYINGSLFVGDGDMTLPQISYHGVNRATYRVPPALLKTGRNDLQYIMVRDGGIPFFSVSPPTIGDYATIKSAYSWRQFSFNTFRSMSQAVGFAAALLAFVLWLRSDRNPAIFWMGVLCLAWALRLQFHRVTYGFFHGEFRIILLYVYVTVVPVALLNFANHWTGHPNRLLSRWSLAGLTAIMAVVGLIIWFGLFDKIDTADRIAMAFLLLIAVVTMGVFIVHYAKREEHRHWEVATFILCATLIAHDSVTTLFDLPDGEHVKRALPVLLLGFLAPFFAGNVRLFRSVSDMNEMLQSQLSMRTAELEAAHGRETELVRSHAHQSERQRIMRDMHDGLGSQLMSMLLAARRGVAKPAAVAEGLQSVIDEMRLLIDSMDSVGESLGSAFAMFRERVQPRVEEAGMAFIWQDSSDGKLPDLDPREVLQVFRIMQEAVTNALRHSGGSVLSVTISPSVERGHMIRICIADNGSGMGKANPRGKGMESMMARATGTGGKLDVQSTGKGVKVCIDLPER